ncbi:MAG: hypothetical protein KDK08_25745 [Rhizobiaceae bacterium]|nr:hypothetical protein [Rhizobiaceae bacterium]
MSDTNRDVQPNSKEARLARAKDLYGHPMNWPRFHEVRPRWWQLEMQRADRRAEAFFGKITEEQRSAFFTELRKGQSIYEDSGEFMLRCYRAMLGLPITEPYTLDQALEDLLGEGETDG